VGVTSVAEGVADLFSLRAVLGKHATGSSSLYMEDGVNHVSKHVKPNRQLQTEGSILKKEAPIHISNVMLFNPSTGRGDRVGFKIEDGKKIRVYKSTGVQVD